MVTTTSQTPTIPIPPPAATALPPIPPLSLIGTSQKREAADSDVIPNKRSRGHDRKQSSSQVMAGMVSSLDRLANVWACDTTITSPQRKSAAIHAIEDDGDLSEHETIKAFRIIRRDTAFADTLLAIRNKESRTRFIKSELYDTDN